MSPIPPFPLTRVRQLTQQIRLLSCAELTDADFLSCYLDLSRGESACREFLDRRAAGLRRSRRGTARNDFDQALDMIRSGLDDHLHPQSRGIALFARGEGGGRFFLAMEFALPLENNLVVSPAPFIYPLLELKDAYDRYLLVLIRQDSVQVADVDLGSTQMRGWVATPKFRRGGIHDEQGRARPARLKRPVPFDKQLRLLTRMLQTGGRTPILLAGDADLIDHVRTWLPPSWAARVVDALPVPANLDLQEAAARSLRTFSECRRRESLDAATRLLRGARRAGAAVSGASASLEALREGRADTLVLSRGCHSGPTGPCDLFDESGVKDRPPKVRPDWAGRSTRSLDTCTELVRVAGQQGVPVALVDSDELSGLGGVGCLLRRRRETRVLNGREAYGSLGFVA